METDQESGESLDGADPDFQVPDGQNHDDHFSHYHFITTALKRNLSTWDMVDIYNSILMDLKVEDPSQYVSQKTMWRQRCKIVKKIQEDHTQNTR